jgi:hypothetical protein
MWRREVMAMNIWEQQKKESAKAYEAFKTYLELGASRSLEMVSQKLGKSKTICDRWSRTHQWVKRALAYDQHIAAIQEKAIEKEAVREAIDWHRERARIRSEALENGKLLIDKARQMLKFPIAQTVIEDGRTIIKPARWSMADAAKFVETADKLQRLAAEMETSNSKVTIEDARETYERLIEGHMKQYGVDRETAVTDLLATKPEAEEFIN